MDPMDIVRADMRAQGHQITDAEIPNYAGGWAVIPFAGGHMVGHHYEEVVEPGVAHMHLGERMRWWMSACSRSVGWTTETKVPAFGLGDARRCRLCERRLHRLSTAPAAAAPPRSG